MEPDVRIDPALLTVFPQIRLGCLAYEATVAPSSPALWSLVEQETVPAVLAELEEKTLAGIEGIRCSREAYKAFGRSPSRYRVSSESLIRRIRQGNPLYHVNTVVDVNNLISLETALSVGSYDLSRLRGPVTLTVGQSGEGYEGIGKSYIDMEHMLLLRDEEGPFGSPTSDSHRAMIRPEPPASSRSSTASPTPSTWTLPWSGPPGSWLNLPERPICTAGSSAEDDPP